MEIIRSVEIVRKKIRITFESGWIVWLNQHISPDFPLEQGVQVNRESFMKFILSHQYPAALDRAVRMLAERPCSKKEIDQRLSYSGYDKEVIELVLYKLEKEKLLDDMEFASQWVESRIRKYGSSRIYRELRIKGIGKETAEEILDTIPEEDQIQHAAAFAEKKIRTLNRTEGTKQIKQRVTAALLRRGYSWDIALHAYEEAMRQKD